MANNTNINKIVYGTSTLIDLTDDTVTSERMYKGIKAHKADGSTTIGTAEITVEDETLIMPEGLCTLIGSTDPNTRRWIRPSYLPDLDSVYNGESNTLWMTVDATGRIADPHVSIKIQGAYSVQVGTIQNGIFISETTESKSSGAIWTKVWTPQENLYPVLKFTTSGNLTYFQWQSWTSSGGYVYAQQYQPIIEMIGDMYSMNNAPRTPYFTEREKIKVGSVTHTEALRYRWQAAYSLQDLDVSDWNTTNWDIRYLTATWQVCISLKHLDVSNWNTSNWAVTTISNTWENCQKLEELDLSNWNTSNWIVTSMANTWTRCYNLKELNVSNWNTSNWEVTSIANTWYLNWRLRELNINHFDTSNWTITSSITGTWQECKSLKKLDLSNWDTSKWVVTAMTSTWSGCFSLEELDVSTWDTSNWTVSNIGTTWYACHKLKKLDLSKWDTSKWTVTALNNTWYQCYQLEELDLSNWNTSNWAVTTITNTFSYCPKLKYLNISTWNTSNWTITSNDSIHIFRGDSSLTKIDYSWIDISKIKAWRTSTNGFELLIMLQDLTFGESNNGKMDTTTTYPSIRFDGCPLLTHESILNIFNALKSGVTDKTLQLGSTNLNKVTAEEKTIATNKGWTLT